MPGFFPSTSLFRQEANRARRNWNSWFHYFNGREILRSHLHSYLQRHIFNRDPFHFLLNTGRFDDRDGAGIRFNKSEARRFDQNQMSTFFDS